MPTKFQHSKKYVNEMSETVTIVDTFVHEELKVPKVLLSAYLLARLTELKS